jgi:hypothetical protein
MTRSQSAERQPNPDGVISDQASDCGGRALSERRFADESAHKLASRRLEHELQF